MDLISMFFWDAIKNASAIKNPAQINEPTVAPAILNPVEVEMTVKPTEANLINLTLSKTEQNSSSLFQKMYDKLLNSFGNIQIPKFLSEDNLKDSLTANITTMEIPDEQGHTVVKILEDESGKTVEVMREIVGTELPTVIGNISKAINGTNTSDVPKENHDNSFNLSIILILSLIISLIVIAGIIMWCKKYRLTSEKRNQYPITSVVNNEYMNPQLMKNNEKVKNIPKE